jgi:hypothetical protein
MVRLAQTMHLSYTNTNTTSKWTETIFYMTHVTQEFHRVSPTQHLSLSYIWRKQWTYLVLGLAISKQTELSFHLSPITEEFHWVRQSDLWAYGTFDANWAPILRQDWHYLQTDGNEHPLESHHLGVPLGASKMISEPMVRLAQTVHIFWTDTNTVSKWTEMRFHMIYVTKGFHQVHQNDFRVFGMFDGNHAPILHQD